MRALGITKVASYARRPAGCLARDPGLGAFGCAGAAPRAPTPAETGANQAQLFLDRRPRKEQEFAMRRQLFL
jgi:hypothetical protein